MEWAITNSTALENLAASLGVRPQDVKNLALQRAKTSVDKNITDQTADRIHQLPRRRRKLTLRPPEKPGYLPIRLLLPSFPPFPIFFPVLSHPACLSASMLLGKLWGGPSSRKLFRR